jgi:hypothetical protein
MRKYHKTFCFIVFLLAVTFILGCGTKVSRANFDKVQTDMTQEEVYKILGEPTETSGLTLGGFSSTTATWKTDNGQISIQFLNGKVVAKQFVTSKDGQPRAKR